MSNEGPLILVEVTRGDVKSNDAIVVWFIGEIDVVDRTGAGLESEPSKRGIEVRSDIGDGIVLNDTVEIFSARTIKKEIGSEKFLLNGFNNELLALTAGNVGTFVSLSMARTDVVEGCRTIHGLGACLKFDGLIACGNGIDIFFARNGELYVDKSRGDIDVDTTKEVDDLSEGLEINDKIVMDR